MDHSDLLLRHLTGSQEAPPGEAFRSRAQAELERLKGARDRLQTVRREVQAQLAVAEQQFRLLCDQIQGLESYLGADGEALPY